MVGKTALNKEMKHLNGAYFRTNYLLIKKMNMEIELDDTQKALVLNDFEEVESKLGHAVPERLKEFYLKWNGGKPKQQTICINRYYEVEIMRFIALNTVEEKNLAQRSSDSNYINILIFAISLNSATLL